MTTLNLSNNQIGPQGVQDLINVLQNNKVIYPSIFYPRYFYLLFRF